jgi:hypothetical protein
MSEQEEKDKHKAKLQHWFDSIEKDGVNLTAWEEDFVASLKKQFLRSGTLSDKQEDILERIYSERTE